MSNPKISKLGRWNNGTFRINRPTADKLKEAISQGHSTVQEPGMASYLGRVAHQTEAFTLSKPTQRTYNSPQTIITPKEYLTQIIETEKYILFGNTKQNTKRRN